MDDINAAALDAFYRDYLDCLNARDWDRLGGFVHDEAKQNGRRFGLAGYRAMLERDSTAIPDLRFEIEMLVVRPPMIASRLRFDCRPSGAFLGLPVDGRRVVFVEHVFYELRDERIAEVWSVIDKAAVEAQLRPVIGQP